VPVISGDGYDLQPRWQMDRLYLSGRLTLRVDAPFTRSPGPQQSTDSRLLEATNERLWQAMAGLLG